MVIAVNIRTLSGNLSMSKWLVDCFETIADIHPEHEFIFIAEKEFTEQKNGFKNVKRIVLPQQSNNPLLWKLWYNYKLPGTIKKLNAAILINADGVCSQGTKVSQCLFINDAALLHYSEWYPKKYCRFIKSNTTVFLQKAKMVVASSNGLKNEIVKHYGAEENKIVVIAVSPGKSYQPLTLEVKEQVKEKYSGGKEYFLFRGAVHPRSNLVNLLKAFSLFKKRQKSNMLLLIASEANSEDNSFIESLKLYKYRNEVNLLTNLDEKSIVEITAAAYACVNTAPLHGDIANLLNAMQCMVPVVAGDFHTAIEILGEAALFANPSVPENIAKKLILLYKDENKRTDLITKAVEQSAKYSLNKTANQLWQNILATIQTTNKV